MLAEIRIFDFNHSKDKIEYERKALIDPDKIESINEMSPTSFNMEEDKFNKIFITPPYIIGLTSGTKFLIDSKEYNDIKKWAKI